MRDGAPGKHAEGGLIETLLLCALQARALGVSRALERDGVADARVRHRLDARRQVAHLARVQRVHLAKDQPLNAAPREMQFVHCSLVRWCFTDRKTIAEQRLGFIETKVCGDKRPQACVGLMLR